MRKLVVAGIICWLAQRWFEGDCESSGFCYEADLNYDRLADFGILAQHWLE
jgi:hypothetical protein